ncbi:MAG: hypothetical protein ABL984_03215 [Pyrinomonadaceae bacterium]
MLELPDLLKERQVKNAVIIDDVFDDYPRPDELDPLDWAIFFDDLGEEGDGFLKSTFPGYEDRSLTELQESAEFIAVVYDNRDHLPEAAWKPLFEGFETSRETERTGLNELVSALETHGLTCSKMGKDIRDEAKQADLIFVDLFLGFKQTEDDMARAIDQIEELVKDRPDRPPLVVLMSRSSRLMDKRNDFRDRAGLPGSTFRVIGKADLAKDGALETLLVRLAGPYDDAKRYAAFLTAWKVGLDKARESFIQRMRRLDLPDLAQIKSLLLDFEGQNLGEYLLDVSDRVLQYEIESDPGTIAAAIELNKVDTNNYRAPHLEGTPDLQGLVHRMIFQHFERLKLADRADPTILQFGDLLRTKDSETGEYTNVVLVILTPACDLLRCSVKNVLVLPGSLEKFAAPDWTYGNTAAKLPIFEDSDGSRYWIRWYTNEYGTIPLSDLRERIDTKLDLVRIARLREMCAIELQQFMLNFLGRIGQIANPPASFPVLVEAFKIDPDGRPMPLDSFGSETAVCFVGRDKDSKRVDHLVLTDMLCDKLRVAAQGLTDDDVHQSARPSLTAMKTDLDFFDRFERGQIELPSNPNAAKLALGLDAKAYITLYRNEWQKENEIVDQNVKKTPIVLKVSDVLSEL